jgi:hypothetical protein
LRLHKGDINAVEAAALRVADPIPAVNVVKSVELTSAPVCPTPSAVDLVGERGSDGGLTDCTVTFHLNSKISPIVSATV